MMFEPDNVAIDTNNSDAEESREEEDEADAIVLMPNIPES